MCQLTTSPCREFWTQRSGEWRVAGISSIVYKTDDGQDEPCEGGGAEARVDIDLDFLSQYVDLDAPICTGEPEPVADDDDDDDDGGEGCECRSGGTASASGRGPVLLLSLILGYRVARRRRATARPSGPAAKATKPGLDTGALEQV